MSAVEYRIGNAQDLDQVIELYHASTLGKRRPVEKPANDVRYVAPCQSGRDGLEDRLLIGIARTLTDFSYVGYLADLAVRAAHSAAESVRT